MKTPSAALTRPRIASGVLSCTRPWRITMLTMSVPPTKTSATSDSQGERDRPKTIVARPKPATETSSVRPIRRRGGRQARIKPVMAAPIAGALRRAPSPTGPQCRIVSA
ncbi:MAG: hypothetical protein WDN69_09745 [Aliidongia sp.]